MKTVSSRNSSSSPRPSGRRLSAVAALACAGLLGLSARPARADLVPGLNVAFTVDALVGAGSLVSIGGNAVDLARGTPSRGWMYSGFIFGFMNTAIGVLVAPIILATSTPPMAIETGNQSMCMDQPTGMTYPCGPDRPGIAIGMAVAHTVVGVTNLGLAIRNAVIWHRKRVAAGMAGTDAQQPIARLRPPVPSPSPSYGVAPLVSRDLKGAPMYGVAFSITGF